MLRILVVDDSPVARGLLTEILNAEPGFEVAGEAVNGAEAVAKVEELKPDIVTMDVQMPQMNGYAATREIMTTRPTPIVVVSGSMGQEDVEKSMQSLDAGALTVISKPPSPSSPQFSQQCSMLVSTLRTMAAVRVIRRHRPRDTDAVNHHEPASPTESLSLKVRPQLVTIAASTGGPHALRTLLEELPGNFPVPIVVVQHISEGFTQGLVDWLDGASDLNVVMASTGEPLKPGYVYLAPEGSHCGVTSEGTIDLIQQPPLRGFRPSATMLFESASRAYGTSHLAIILTGMGSDGVDGLRSVRETGGSIIAQDADSCVVYGMPKAAVEAEVVDIVLPLSQIGNTLIKSVTEQPT